MKRLEVRLKRPNALFERWLEHWLDDAIKRGSHSQIKIRAALESLRSYPLPLASGRECAVLRGFGPTLCNRIDEELKQYRENAKNRLQTTVKHHTNLSKLVTKLMHEKMKRDAERISPRCAPPLPEDDILNDSNKSFLPDTFKILLLVDTQETNGKNKKFIDETRMNLNQMGVPYEVRRLALGDFIWIARERTTGRELVLPYIVERKRIDDLANSIRDGRFPEQKHRMKRSGIPNVVYLIESYDTNTRFLSLPQANLKQAIINTIVYDGFMVVQTDSNQKTCVHLRAFTDFLTDQFRMKTLQCVDSKHEPRKGKYVIKDCGSVPAVKLFKYRVLATITNPHYDLKVHELFLKQLLQLHSLTLEKALTIARVYETPGCLMAAYNRMPSSDEGRKMLSKLRYGPLRRQIGDKISGIVYEFYTAAF